MKRIFLFITAIALFVSCTDSTDGIGMSLMTDTNEDVDVKAATFTVASNSVKAGDIISRSATGYLGKIKDPETGSYVTCNFMTQVRGGGVTQLPYKTDFDNFSLDSLVADSCELCVYFNTSYGDSLALMKVVAHELETPFEERYTYSTSQVIDSAKAKIRTNGIHAQQSYTYSNHVYTDTQRANSSYNPLIAFTLNDPYTDKAGNQYNNYGTYLLRKVYANMEDCSRDYWFTHNVCPGFYIETLGGIGNLASIRFTQLFVFFHGTKNGSKFTAQVSFAGTEETLQKTGIVQDESKINSMMNDDSYTYLKTPAALFTQLTIPVDSIMKGHETDTLSTVRIFVPRVNNDQENTYNLPTPSTVLLLPTDSVESFFANRKVADSKISYLTAYGSAYNGYTFSNISNLVTKMYRVTNRTENWNKVTIIPVETTTSTLSSGSSQITKVTYDMSLGSTRLKKGQIGSNNIRASVLYSHFK